MKVKTFFTAIFLLLLTSCLSAQKTEVLTNKTIIELCKGGLSDKTIISKIQSSTCKFDVSSTGMLALAKQKVPDTIIDVMVTKSSSGNENGSPIVAGKATVQPTAAPVKSTQVPDLDFINVPHFFNKVQNMLVVLERSTVAVKAKVSFLNAMIPGTSTPIVFRMDSVQSPVRLPEQESLSFMINTGANIPEIFGLYKMSVFKKKREATWFNVSAFDNKSDKDVIAFNYKKVKDGVYEVVPVSKLSKGEYCFVNKASYGTYGGAKADVFAFGID